MILKEYFYIISLYDMIFQNLKLVKILTDSHSSYFVIKKRKIIVNNSIYFQLTANNSTFWNFFDNPIFAFSLLPIDPSNKWPAISGYFSSFSFFIIILSIFHYQPIILPLKFCSIIQHLLFICCQWTLQKAKWNCYYFPSLWSWSLHK